MLKNLGYGLQAAGVREQRSSGDEDLIMMKVWVKWGNGRNRF